jgi:hypothetical protein
VHRLDRPGVEIVLGGMSLAAARVGLTTAAEKGGAPRNPVPAWRRR